MLISPGVYVPPMPQFPKVFHNMGVRIEVRNPIPFTVTCSVLISPQDEVLVGKDHAVVLSVAAPKEVGFFSPPLGSTIIKLFVTI